MSLWQQYLKEHKDDILVPDVPESMRDAIYNWLYETARTLPDPYAVAVELKNRFGIDDAIPRNRPNNYLPAEPQYRFTEFLFNQALIEGVNRALSNKGVVKIGQTFTPIVGRVCMNHTIIGLDGVRAKVGDEVMVYSNDPADKNAIDQIAKTYDLFNYNLLTSLSPDIRRVLVR